MQSKVGIGIGAGRGNLRKDRLLDHQVPAHVHDGLSQAGDQIGAELLVCNQIQCSSQGREIVVRDRRSAAQCTLWYVKALISTLGFRYRSGGIDGDQDGQGLWSLLEKPSHQRQVFLRQRDYNKKSADLL